MTKRKQQVTEENLFVSRSMNKRASNHGEEIQYFDLITVDLIIKILSKLSSAKSVAQCRCVSKLWSSFICQPNYKQLFPVKSLDPLRLLFTFKVRGKFCFYTSPQLQNPDVNSSLVATRHHTNSSFSQIPRAHVQGLFCYQRRTEDYCMEVVISNPITGQYVALPKVKPKVTQRIRSYLCYDPIGKQFKVLCISWVPHWPVNLSVKHQVLTLENGRRNRLWRKIECYTRPYVPTDDDMICINGVLYYITWDNGPMIGCFDVSSERLDFISEIPSNNLINYKGKLGAVDNHNDNDLVLWVFEDYEKRIWSKYVYEKPLQWREELNSTHFARVIDTGEILLCPRYATQAPFYIYYYNLEKNIVVKVRVEVPGKGSRKLRFYTFPNFVENVMLM